MPRQYFHFDFFCRDEGGGGGGGGYKQHYGSVLYTVLSVNAKKDILCLYALFECVKHGLSVL